MSGGDILIGKTMPVPVVGGKNPHATKRDSSTAMRNAETGVVDKVMLSTNADGYRFVKVRVRAIRIPQVGDKFSSRHGQKVRPLLPLLDRRCRGLADPAGGRRVPLAWRTDRKTCRSRGMASCPTLS